MAHEQACNNATPTQRGARTACSRRRRRKPWRVALHLHGHRQRGADGDGWRAPHDHGDDGIVRRLRVHYRHVQQLMRQATLVEQLQRVLRARVAYRFQRRHLGGAPLHTPGAARRRAHAGRTAREGVQNAASRWRRHLSATRLSKHRARPCAPRSRGRTVRCDETSTRTFVAQAFQPRLARTRPTPTPSLPRF